MFFYPYRGKSRPLKLASSTCLYICLFILILLPLYIGIERGRTLALDPSQIADSYNSFWYSKVISGSHCCCSTSSDTPYQKSLLLMLTIKQLVNLDPMGRCTSDKGSVMRVHQSSIRKRNFIKVYWTTRSLGTYYFSNITQVKSSSNFNLTELFSSK